jgi:simple sugar transport system permease protein
MVISGMLAGLSGASETLGLQGRFYNVSPGYGFTAIAVGLVGRNHPIGVIAAGLLFGVLRAGATEMQNTADVSREIVQVLQGLVILAVAASSYVSMMRQRRKAAREAISAPASAGLPPAGAAGADS